MEAEKRDPGKQVVGELVKDGSELKAAESGKYVSRYFRLRLGSIIVRLYFETIA